MGAPRASLFFFFESAFRLRSAPEAPERLSFAGDRRFVHEGHAGVLAFLRMSGAVAAPAPLAAERLSFVGDGYVGCCRRTSSARRRTALVRRGWVFRAWRSRVL